ncbi:hypothetical protein PoB_002351000 [Plakobranchus ocellatus]|uniref:Uncharacterized protein n=1 Tax=Plakobranchus ocellatus TaxID=259542 RepID=A0AAV3ZPC0_9GAST|nr:hypothetical protein PoB_002351000 [Plakobranchus ocellatus]
MYTLTCIYQSCKLTNAAEKNDVVTSNHTVYAPIRHSKYQPGIEIASGPVCNRKNPPPEISKTSALVPCRQYPPPRISKVSAPARLRQHPPPRISKASSAPARLRQHPPPRISKASAPVRGRQNPP